MVHVPLDRCDIGIGHALLGLGTKDDILGHPVAGQTRETLVLETLITAAPDGTEAGFYRATAGASLTLCLYYNSADIIECR